MKSKSALLHVVGVYGSMGILIAAAPRQTQAQDGLPTAHGTILLKQQSARPDETARFHIVIKISDVSAAPGQVVTISEDFERRTREAKRDGVITLVDTFRSGTVSFGAAPQDILKLLPVVTIVRDKDGKYTSTADGGSAEGNPEVLGVLQQFAAAADSLLPDKAVSVGGKWKVAFENADTLIGGAKLAGEAEYAGPEQIRGTKTSRIKFALYEDGHEADKQGQGEGVLNVDGRGRIVRLVQKGRGIFAGGPATVEIEIMRNNGKDAVKKEAVTPARE